MKALIQRVQQAQVRVDEKIVGKIDQGILALIGIEKNDDHSNVQKLLKKLINYRIFSDPTGKMNLSLKDINGDLLLVSQFTLVADTQKGLRPSFSKAADPTLSRELYQYLIDQAKQTPIHVETGVFAADMKISLINDGPVTFNLHC